MAVISGQPCSQRRMQSAAVLVGGAIGAWAAGQAAAAAGALLLTEIVWRTAECSEYSRNAIDSCSTKLLFVQQNQVLFNKSLCFVQQN